ncbi:nucleoside triphosphate pyrophosphohydrolase [Ponticaulis sp.]|uniref:nucleoside triphosphate pyrophosphohydrolase n=1 Tax=Ponticaulis sp. TaxID=2020902 RepID=UPI000B68262E|nr:nucleoside triphosphate pyrophosphohydrolase [Ponticaulis sp.]MAI89398.1 nucleoside triphosphate pyrophosphohydrolase [Ponticaulis sp.]OUY00438.1 MAG: nucleoside triphosphate pyrophosphohydrolase [Hyphomonadaceae bacterium TMED5]|tara:strand:+ start:40385 stop:41215 length:831 start_codon:yes stop_codon:yes gene_type:complete
MPYSSAEIEALSGIDQLLAIMAALRTPDTGCPWDLEQTFETIAPYTIEEAYEVADAIERKDMVELRSELGDLMFQVVFYSQMASETGEFVFNDVVAGISEKMIRRHPHVFGNADHRDADAQTVAWEEIKAAERAASSSNQQSKPTGALDGVANALPAVIRAEKLQKRAARVGFDWPNAKNVLEKLDEEVDEVKTAIDSGVRDDIEDEIGDLMFVLVNLCRKTGIDPEKALKRANGKFVRRFEGMESIARERDQDFGALALDEQEALWQEVKRRTRG